MKNIMILGLALLIFFSLSNCGNDDEVNKEVKSTAEITVKNTSGDVEAGVKVYIFDLPSTDPNGKNPDFAINSDVTNENGVVKFNLENISVSEAGKTIYFTALEERLSGEQKVLGSINVTLQKDEPVELMEEIVVFDRTLKYENGFIPTTISSSLAMSEYNRYKNELRRTCGDGYRIIADPSNETRVEAIGFGMLLSAYANDRETFDGLFEFYKSKRTEQANNMMAWLVTCDGIEDPGSATDGDIDVAFSLIIADQQWGGSYLESAKEIINIIKNSLIIDCEVGGETVKVLGPGYSSGMWGGCGMTDIQYYTPAFFRVFADVTGDNTWDELADDTYTLLNASANDDTGLVPDWQTAGGDPGPGSRAGHFGYDACRVPWRIALDYLWNGNTKAKTWCNKVSDWAFGVGPANIVDGYELDGTPIGENGLNSAFLGGFSVASMTNTQGMADQFAIELSELNDSYWFNLNTRCLYLFTLTGNFQKPS